MNETKEHFLETTRRYFLDTNNNIVQEKNNTLDTQPKKYYIKEDPFINSSNVNCK